MLKKYKIEFITGFIVIVTIGIVLWGFNYLKGKDVFKHEKHYFAIYDKIGGLIVSSPVFVNGFKVGQVSDIHLIADNSGKIAVDFILNIDVNFPKGSVAKIYSYDLMGTKAIEVIFSKSPEFHQPNDTLLTDIERDLKEEVNAQMIPLKNKAESLMMTFDSLLVAFQSVFTDSVRENLRKSFKSIKITVQNLSRTTASFDTLVSEQSKRIVLILENIEHITSTIKENSKQLSNIFENFSNISDSVAKIHFAETMTNLNSSLEKASVILDKLTKGEGTAGQLLNNDELYNNLKKSANDLDKLLKDIQENPDRYVNFSIFHFGKKQKSNEPTSELHSKKKEKLSDLKDVTYKIQVFSTTKRLPETHKMFSNLENVEMRNSGKFFKYFTGSNTNFDSILLVRKKVINDFPDCFIVAFKNDSLLN